MGWLEQIDRIPDRNVPRAVTTHLDLPKGGDRLPDRVPQGAPPIAVFLDLPLVPIPAGATPNQTGFEGLRQLA